jgi:hypothetical protein
MLHARSFRFSMTRLWRHLRIRDCGGNGGRARNADPGVLPATQVLDLSVRRMILVRADTLGRQQNDLGTPDMLLRALWSRANALSWRRSDGVTVREISARMPKTRTRNPDRENQTGVKRQILSNSVTIE